MRITAGNTLRQLWAHCVTVAATLIARVRRGETPDSVEARLWSRPARDRAMIVGATLAGLFVTALLAAQGGLFGMAAFFVAVILLVG
jgi:hypothetical protein